MATASLSRRPLPSNAAAAAAVTTGAERLRRHGITWQLATSRTVDTFTRSYDTLVLSVPRETPPWHARVLPKRASVVATDLREVLESWHAVSQREWLSFEYNLEFWVAALGLKLSEDPVTMEIASVVFPRVVIWWNPTGGSMFERFDVEKERNLLKTRVLDLFRKAPKTATGPPIECTLRVRLTPTAKATKAMLDFIVVQAKASVAVRSKTRVVWTGVELIRRHYHEVARPGLEVNQLKMIRDFMLAMPTSLTVDMRLNSEDYRERQAMQTTGQLESRCLVSFLHASLGYSYGNSLGRLQMVDLKNTLKSTQAVSGGQTVFSSLCTLLPFTTSLRELRVEIANRTELLWLAYALFHPRTPQTNWRALTLGISENFRGSVNLHVWTRLLSSRTRLSTLRELLASDQDAAQGPNSAIDGESCIGFVWRTAVVVKRTSLYESADKARVVVSLARDTLVELCGASPGDDSDVDAPVPVIAAGYGLGYVCRSDLTSFVEKEYPGPPRSCIAYIAFDQTPFSPGDQEILLRLMGESLIQLHTMYPNWLQSANLVDLVPNIQSIDCITFCSSVEESKLSVLPGLQFLGVRCSEQNIAQCEDWLCRQGRLSGLRDLRMQLSLPLNTEEEDIATHFEKVVFNKRSLRRISYFLAHNEGLPWVPTISRHVRLNHNISARNLAFLSAIHYYQGASRPRPHAIASLDSNLLRHIFALTGPSLEYMRLGVVALRDLGRTVNQKDEIDTSSDAWFDDYWNNI